ncbi:MAG: exo-alpha-sialidase [Clostridiales bacterium]|nr:exo-alpha-sialidase [Clostridiales bacterium]
MRTIHKRTVLVLSPDAEYPRHSEGAFLRLADGSILFAYSRFHGGTGDDAASDIVGLRSTDEGETWGAPEVLVQAADHNTHNAMSVSLLRMANGDLGLFYLVKPNAWTYQTWLARSRDDGRTFYRRTMCTHHQGDGVYVMNNDRVVRLSTGRIVLPLAYHRVIRLPGEGRYYDYRAVACFLFSDDDGETFVESADTLALASPRTRSGLQEPGVMELKNGALWAYMRTDMLWQYESFSMDQGAHWTQAQPSRFSSPCSPMLVKRAPDSALVAVYNPTPNYNGRAAPRHTGGRTPLALSISRDEGISWQDNLLENEPTRGYCYPAIFFTNDDAMLVSYCSAGEGQPFCLTESTISKVPLSELM